MTTWADELESLRCALHYEPETGVFRWRVARGKVRAGDVAGRSGAAGYSYICFNRKAYLAHRLAWALQFGEMPQGEVDHRDGNRRNNIITNLRVVDRAGNSRNRHGAGKNSKTGFLGVGTNPSTRRFRARIVVNLEPIHLGYFDTAEQAHKAYVTAKRKLHDTGML